MPLNDNKNPLTIADLESILEKRSQANEILEGIKAVKESVDNLRESQKELRQDFNTLNSRLLLAETADARHERAVTEYKGEIKVLTDRIIALEKEQAIDRVKLAAIVSGAMLVVSAIVSFVMNYLFKTSGGSK